MSAANTNLLELLRIASCLPYSAFLIAIRKYQVRVDVLAEVVYSPDCVGRAGTWRVRFLSTGALLGHDVEDHT
jgi:hypothetical protein